MPSTSAIPFQTGQQVNWMSKSMAIALRPWIWILPPLGSTLLEIRSRIQPVRVLVLVSVSMKLTPSWAMFNCRQAIRLPWSKRRGIMLPTVLTLSNWKRTKAPKPNLKILSVSPIRVPLPMTVRMTAKPSWLPLRMLNRPAKMSTFQLVNLI